MLNVILRSVALGTRLLALYGVHKAKTFDLMEGEAVLRQREVSWVQGALKVDGVLSLTNRRLHFEFFEEYLSYPLENIVAVRLANVWRIIPNGIELEFSDSRKALFALRKREEWVTEILKAQKPLLTSGETEKTADGAILTFDQACLRRNLTFSLDESELNTLSFDLGVDYETLPGETKVEKARELIVSCERQGLRSRLVKECTKLRPNVHW